jgi:hypothetical protein
LLASFVCFSQIKSLEDAQNEAKNFNDFAAFSVSYDESKYLTKAEISIEVLGEKDDLRKRFSKFEWQFTSLFAIKGIDAKPVRNVLCINSQSKIFAFSRENTLTILFSDGDVDFGEPNRLSEIKKGKANETLCWEVEQEIFRDFAKSDKIEFQIGTIKGQIRADKMQIFKDYAKLLEVKDNGNSK